jgi:hypothetical protein
MIKQPLLISTLVAALLLTTGSVFAADTAKVQTYGSQMMTEKERNEHRTDMQNAKTEEERAKVRNEHHERMKVRAKEQGVSIPDKPPVRGKGMGKGQGKGQGQGQGMSYGKGK